MLFYHFDLICNGVLVILLIVLACVIHTYLVNLRRKADDPKKREYHPLAILLWPLTFGIFLALWMSAIFIFVLRALLFAGFLFIFTVLLVARRKPFIFTLWDKFATKIGDPLLEIGTHLTSMASGLWVREPQPI